MFQFIQEQLAFFLTIILVLFVPGYSLLRAFSGKDRIFSSLEKFILSPALGIVAVSFLMLVLGRFGLALSRSNLIFSIGLFSLVALLISELRKKGKSQDGMGEETRLFTFSKRQIGLIAAILFLTVFFKAAYAKDHILPSTTDLGHHMYWTNQIIGTGELPDYAKRDIIQVDGKHQLGASLPISDFIIGEHLIFAAVGTISGISVISYFPVLLLFLINLLGILSIFVLALRMFEGHPRGKDIAIMALLFIGPLFAIAPPQEKFVAGGVIGNIMGNLLLPLIFYVFYRFIRERRPAFLVLALFLSMGLFYTHHLTGLLFILSAAVFVVLGLVFRYKDTAGIFSEFKRRAVFVPLFLFLAFAAVFVFYIHTPSYLENQAVSTVVGSPAKKEHTGMAFSDYKYLVGEPRAAIGLFGLVLLLIGMAKNRKGSQDGHAPLVLAGWLFIVMGISLWPGFFRLSIPSSRVANYGSYPLSILAAYGLVHIFQLARQEGKGKYYFGTGLLAAAFLTLLFFTVGKGLYDNSQQIIPEKTQAKTIQTYHASRYLSGVSGPDDFVLTDHIFIASDSWIKLFFMRDYNFPLYRANLDRYENGIDKTEFCTLWVVSDPSSEDSRKCIDDLNMRYFMVSRNDSPQFEERQDFSKIYSDDEIDIFFKPSS